MIKEINFLGSKMHAVSMTETLEFINQRIKEKVFTQHVVVNVAKLVNMRSDSELKESVEVCDIINIDGMGVVFGARLLGFDIPERVAGIDLFLSLVALAEKENYPIFLLGAQQKVVEVVRKNLLDNHKNLIIAGTHHGYFWDDEKAVVDKISQSDAKLLFVAITSPKKENFINRWKDELKVDFVMGVGGSFDVVAEKVDRAPAFIQTIGMEWLYRVAQEPRRLWKRYFISNTLFLILLIKEYLGRLRK